MFRYFLLSIAVVCCFPSLALANMYKCADANGKVTYSGTPCETTQVHQKTMRKSGVETTPRQSQAGGQGWKTEEPTSAECDKLGGHFVAGEGCLKEAPRNRSPGVAPARVAEECRKRGERYVPALNACAQ